MTKKGLARDTFSCSSDVEARRGKIVGLFESVLKLHKDLPKSKSPDEQESTNRQIAATDR